MKEWMITDDNGDKVSVLGECVEDALDQYVSLFDGIWKKSDFGYEAATEECFYGTGECGENWLFNIVEVDN